jgi:hypothetical protein
MDGRVFISHRTNKGDAILLRAIMKGCREAGLAPYLAEREFSPTSVTEKLRSAIRDCDFLVALLTEGGAVSVWVNQELAIGNEMGKTIIPLLEAGTDPPGFIRERDQIRFERVLFDEALSRAVGFMLRVKADQAPLFRIQASLGERGREVHHVFSVIDVDQVQPNGVRRTLSRIEVEKALNEEPPQGSSLGTFELRVNFEDRGVQNLIWIRSDRLYMVGPKIGEGLYYWPYYLVPV